MGVARFGAVVSAVVSVGCASLGAGADGARQWRIESSRQWEDGQFRNELDPVYAPVPEILWAWMTSSDEYDRPEVPVPVVALSREAFASLPESGLRITWMGHSSFLVEIDGYRLLVDPVWSERCSPVSWTGPKRFHPPPIALEDLPPIHAVVISHDHYDHLDYETIEALQNRVPRFVVPLGVGAHLEHWGIRSSHIVELDWWESTKLGNLTLTATPARHFSGRSLADRDQTLWAGWAVHGPNHRIFYSGDTAMFPGFEEIGERLGPFDVALIETGQYNRMWRDVHLGPEQGVVALQMVRGRLYVPVHWGTFSLSLHGWTEPVERLLRAAKRLDVDVFIPRPGEPFEPSAPPPDERWWPERPVRRSEEHLVMSSGLPRELRTRVWQAHGLRGDPPPPKVRCVVHRRKICKEVQP